MSQLKKDELALLNIFDRWQYSGITNIESDYHHKYWLLGVDKLPAAKIYKFCYKQPLATLASWYTISNVWGVWRCYWRSGWCLHYVTLTGVIWLHPHHSPALMPMQCIYMKIWYHTKVCTDNQSNYHVISGYENLWFGRSNYIIRLQTVIFKYFLNC